MPPSKRPRTSNTQFYAVLSANNLTGSAIFTQWADCEKAVKDELGNLYPGAKFRKCSQIQEAVAFITQPDDPTDISPKKTKTTQPTDSGTIKIYTDGACTNNGKKGALAGWGVFYGPNDHRNKCGPVTVGPMTNQRAELQAIREALNDVKNGTVEIVSDSKYAIQCATTWIKAWKRNNFTASNGKPVLNQDLVKDIDRLITERGAENTKFTWVAGHSGDPSNDAADHLARKGATQTF